MSKGMRPHVPIKQGESWPENQGRYSPSSFLLAYDVVLLASQQLRRQAWLALLDNVPEIVIQGVYSSADELQRAQIDSEAIVLVDGSGEEQQVAVVLQKLLPSARAIFFVNSYAYDEIVPILQSGASGCIKYDATVGELTAAIAAVASGQIALPADVAAGALARLANPSNPTHGDLSLLSDRESEVIDHLVKGQTNKEIARDLDLSVRTIEAHLRNIYGKLGVSTRTEAVLMALRVSFN